MAFYRSLKRNIINNDNPLYNNKFIEKGVKRIRHLSTPTLIYPSTDELRSIVFVDYIWKQGDSYEKLSATYYGDPVYWWVIAFINNKPTEQHLSVGDTISIPTPLTSILSIIGY